MRSSKKSISLALSIGAILALLTLSMVSAKAQEAKQPETKSAKDASKETPQEEIKPDRADKIISEGLDGKVSLEELDIDLGGDDDLVIRTYAPNNETVILQVRTDENGYLVATLPYPVTIMQRSAPFHLHADGLVLWVKKRPGVGDTISDNIQDLVKNIENMELYAEGHVWMTFGAKEQRFTSSGSRAFISIDNSKPDEHGKVTSTLRGVFDDAVAHTENITQHERNLAEGVSLGNSGKEDVDNSGVDSIAARGNLKVDAKDDKVFSLERGERIFIRSARMVINNANNRNGAATDISLTDPSVSRSSLAVPSFSFRATKMRVQLSPTRNIASIKDPSAWIRSSRLVKFHIDNYQHDMDARFPVRRFSFGQSDAFGTTFRTQVNLIDGYDYFWDPEPTFRPFAFSLGYDHLSSRGNGISTELEYRKLKPFRNGFRTFLHAYSINDSGDDRDVARNLGFFPLRRSERGRVRGFVQGRFGDGYQLDAHVNYESDRTFIQEFFDDEFDKNDVDSTFLRLTRHTFGRAYYAGATFRARDFVDEVERLPVLGFASHRERVGPEGAGLHLTTRGEFGLYRLHLDDSGHIHDGKEILRGDMRAILHRPFDLGVIVAEPYIGGRLTFSDTRFVAGATENRLYDGALGFRPPAIDGSLEEDLVSRPQLLFGINLQSNFSRTFAGVNSKLFNLKGLRHTITPSARWENAIGPGHRELDFVQLDEVDAIGNQNRVTLGLRNRFQTRRRIKGKMRNVDFADVLLEVPLYPNAGRDNNDQLFGPLEVQGRFRPNSAIALDAGAFFETRKFNWQRWYVAAHTQAFNTDFTLFYRSVRHEHEIAGITTKTRFSRTYSFATEFEYDFQVGQTRDLKFQISRTFFDTFIANLNLKRDVVRDDFEISVSLSANFGPASYHAADPDTE